uniref:Secreted protein n=1 Tax=Ixodes ricinus TaxID=34613 RepID=A0A6B0UJ63_IXORI
MRTSRYFRLKAWGLQLSHLLLNLEALTGYSLVLCTQSNPIQGLDWICRLFHLHRAAHSTSNEQSPRSALVSRIYCLFFCPQVFAQGTRWRVRLIFPDWARLLTISLTIP